MTSWCLWDGLVSWAHQVDTDTDQTLGTTQTQAASWAELEHDETICFASFFCYKEVTISPENFKSKVKQKCGVFIRLCFIYLFNDQDYDLR